MKAPIPPLPAPIHALDFAPLEALVRAAFARELADRPLVATPMPGGASTRRYFRVEVPGASAVAMFVPEGAKAEEVQKNESTRIRVRTWPFLEVRELLAGRGVDVPRVYGEDTSRGWLLIEDLGDDTLANYLARNPADKASLYTRAVTDLAHAQAALRELPEDSIVGARAFDADLLSWEIHHFREWGLEARGIPLNAADRALFDGVAERLAQRIAAMPRGFTHRDYQSRNLMVRASKKLCWIDFQDALLGPHVYDLVALLNDSYQQFDRAFVEARLFEYASAAELPAEARARIVREFDLVTVQRKLKDAGRFVFIDRVKNNPSFLQFVEPTIKKVKSSLERLSDDADMAALAAMLRRVLPSREREREREEA